MYFPIAVRSSSLGVAPGSGSPLIINITRTIVPPSPFGLAGGPPLPTTAGLTVAPSRLALDSILAVTATPWRSQRERYIAAVLVLVSTLATP